MAANDSQSGSEPSVVYFDEDGDTRLLLTRGGHEHTYVVASKAMSLVCRAWKSMLSPKSGFREATLVGSGGSIPLPDDDPDALKILLNIAHMHFDRVPKTLKFRTLLHVAELTEKYGAIKILQPWIKEWLQAVEHLVEKAGYEEWLFIAWAFGEKDKFEKLSTRLARTVDVNELGQCVTPEGKVLDPSIETVLFPPEIIERILERRLQVLDFMLDLCYKRVDDYISISTNPGVYRCNFFIKVGTVTAEACDTLGFGSLVLALSKIGLGPQRKDATDVTNSIETIGIHLRTAELPDLGETWGLDRNTVCDHSICTPETHMKSIAKFVDRIASPVLPSHCNHMEQKRNELLGICHNAQPDSQQPSEPHRKKRKHRP